MALDKIEEANPNVDMEGKIEEANPNVDMEGQGVPERVGELKKKSSEFENQYMTALPPFEAPTSQRRLETVPTSQRRLEIVVKKGKGLQNVHRTHSLKTHPFVFIGDEDGKLVYGLKKQKPVNLNGGSNPEWDAYDEFSVFLDEAWVKKHYLFVTVKSKRKIRSGSKFVGEYRVSIEELLNDYGDAVDKKELTRPVMNKKGEAHGSVTFVYEFVRTPDPQPAAPLPQPADPPLPQPADPPQPEDRADPPQPADPPLVPPRNSSGRAFLKEFVGGVVGELVGNLTGVFLNRAISG